jgi:uncharacterized membrane protein YhiD involved in acid resistance
MNTATKMLAVAGVTTLIGAGTFAGVASAQATNSVQGNDSLVDKITQKFNLNKDDVQKVFDENKADRQAERQQHIEDRLNQAVKDGKITEAQKAAILDKMQEMQTYLDSIKDKTADEKRGLMKTKMDELKKWADDNGLSQYLPMMVGRGHHGMGMGMHGDNPSSSDVPVSQ